MSGSFYIRHSHLIHGSYKKMHQCSFNLQNIVYYDDVASYCGYYDDGLLVEQQLCHS